MARVRSPNRDIAFEIYKEHNGDITNREIANILGEKEKTVSNWKCRDKWDCSTTKKECSTTNKKGGQPGNKNGKGGPPGNRKAETHGFFSKYLPEETFNIIQEIKQKDPIDILWDNIQIQYAAIIRSQSIMYVKDKEEMIKVLKKESYGQAQMEEYEFQFAWDRQATYLQAQSRAMKTLESMIKQYDELTSKGLATEEQKARIAVLKSKIVESSEEKSKEGIEEFIKATTIDEEEVSSIFKDDENEQEKTD